MNDSESLAGDIRLEESKCMLVIDGSGTLIEVLGRTFRNSYRIVQASDGLSGLIETIRWLPDIILLHSHSAKVDCTELCKRFRDISSGILLVLADENMTENERIACFEAGADDVVSKDASDRELYLRIQVLLRRGDNGSGKIDNVSSLNYGPLRMESSNYRVHVFNQELVLTRKEFLILWTMAAKSGQVVSRSELMKRVWKYEVSGDDRMIDTHLNRLRKKMQPHASHLRIKTAWGIGYKLEYSDI